MKRPLNIAVLILCMSFPITGAANPFKNTYVCAPNVVPSQTHLEFNIRDGGPCAPGEKWMKVIPQRDGTILLYPTNSPLSSQDQKDLKKFKRFYGLDP